MPKLDLSSIAKKVQKSAGEVTKTVADAAGKLPDVKTENVTDALKEASKKGQAAFSSAVSKGKEVLAGSGEDKAGTVDEETKREIVLSPKDALQIVYGLMVIDSNISPEEEEKFFLIGKEFDPKFEEYKAELLNECKAWTKEAVDQQDHYDIIHDHIQNIIHSADRNKDEGIRGKLLLWDLFAIAYSDNHYDESEKRLIRFISRSLQIDQVTVMEMEQTLQTVTAIETEMEWLRTTDRQYRKIEERMNELSDRKQAIMQSIQMLITD